MAKTCAGPLIWRDVSDTEPERGAVLECAATGCDYVIATGGLNDEAHALTEVMREGLA